MKSWSAKSRRSDEALESALRNSKPTTEIPAALHNSIMSAVQAVCREEDARLGQTWIIRRFASARWLPIAGLASLALVSLWLAVSHRSDRMTSNTQSLPEISTAFSASREVVDALPSATVGPLSDELDNVGRDLDRTAEFLLATLP